VEGKLGLKTGEESTWHRFRKGKIFRGKKEKGRALAPAGSRYFLLGLETKKNLREKRLKVGGVNVPEWKKKEESAQIMCGKGGLKGGDTKP